MFCDCTQGPVFFLMHFFAYVIFRFIKNNILYITVSVLYSDLSGFQTTVLRQVYGASRFQTVSEIWLYSIEMHLDFRQLGMSGFRPCLCNL